MAGLSPAQCRNIVSLAGRSPFHLNPDGGLLAMTISAGLIPKNGADYGFDEYGVSLEAAGSEVLLVDTASGRVTRPFPDSTSWAPRWSPDGKTLAAYVRRGESLPQLAFWDRRSGDVRLSLPVRPFFGFEVPQWAADSNSVVVKAAPIGALLPGPAIPPTDRSVRVLSTEAAAPQAEALPGFVEMHRADLAVVDRDSDEACRILTAVPVTGWRTAPNRAAVAAFSFSSAVSEEQQNFYDLIVQPIDGGPSKTLASAIPNDYGITFSWAPDDQHIAYFAVRQGEPIRVFAVPVDGSTGPQELTDDVTRPPAVPTMADTYSYNGPRWISGEEIVIPHPDGYARLSLAGPGRLFTTRTGDWLAPTPGNSLPASALTLLKDTDTRDQVVQSVDLNTGRTTELRRWPARSVEPRFASEVGADGSVYLALESSGHPTEVWHYDRQFQSGRRLLDLNPSIDRAILGSARLARWKSGSGETIRGALKLPSEGEAPFPLVVNVYGGIPLSHHVHSFDILDSIHVQLLTSRGYTVLLPDIPMTDGPPVGQFADAVVPGIHSLIDDGIVDPDRIGIMGNSFGSYTTLALLTQTQLFQAAVITAPVVNPISSYLAVNDSGDDLQGLWESGQGRLGGTLWERPEVYVENSPAMHLDRVTTPVLVGVGTRGLPGETAQGIEVFAGLRRLGRAAEVRIYEGEDHWPGMWSESSYLNFADRAIEWFGRYLR